MCSLFHEIKLPAPSGTGSLTIPGNIFLAPLAGYTDRAYRDICLEYGADLTYTEMVSCVGIIRGNKKTIDLMTRGRREKILAVQLFTGDPESAAASIPGLKSFKPEMIDLNCGCPVPKVTKAGAGSALMNTPEKLRDIVKAMRKALADEGMDIPVTVKIRSGWDKTSLNWRETALRAVEGGAAMITLHPRTRKQGYSGTSDWELIMRLKEIMPIPVIGSGDLFSAEAIKSMLETTGCDGVMAARGAIGNPYIFRMTKELLSREGKRSDEAEVNAELPATTPTPEEKIRAAAEHIALASEYFPPQQACRELKKHLCAYTKGIPAGASLRNKLVHVQDVHDYIPMMEHFLSDPDGFSKSDAFTGD